MFNDAKYIMFTLTEDATEHFMIIDAGQTHSEAVRHLAMSLRNDNVLSDDLPYQVVSAGFVSIGLRADGHSSSLKHSGHAYLSRKADADIIAAAHAATGLFVTLSDRGLTLVGPTFNAEQVNAIFAHHDIDSQGHLSLKINAERHVEIASMNHLIKPDSELAKKLERKTLMSLNCN
ncbi:MAG: hypothetical protein RSD49_07955 [Hafnia sp.]